MIHDIALQSNHDRSRVAAHIQRERAKGPFRVLDVGGYIPMPGVIPDAIVDIQDPKNGVRLFQGNISMPEVWGQVLEYVSEHGMFDFCVYSHTLEDIANPKLVCDCIQRIARNGYIAVPARHIELSRGVDGPYRGYQHHRWVFTLTKDKQFIGYPKLGFLEHEPAFDSLANIGAMDFSFFWQTEINLEIVNNDFLGPTVAHVTDYYKKGLLGDYFTGDWQRKKLATTKSKLRIAIHANEFDERGCGCSPYYYGQALKARGHEVWFFSGNGRNAAMGALSAIGPVILYTASVGVDEPEIIRGHLERLVAEQEIDLLHMLKFGIDDHITPRNCRTAIHCIFDMSQPHGDAYVAVSQYLAHKFHRVAFVPHIVENMLPTEDLRKELGIPKDALVIGRHGGSDQFDLQWVRAAVAQTAEERSDVYFLFLNTARFAVHPRILHLPYVRDRQDVFNFIHACDAMIHGRQMGETFGLACAEFAAAGKPVITWDGTGAAGVFDSAHIIHLGAMAELYSNQTGLRNILRTIDKRHLYNKTFNCPTDYTFSAKHVMALYEQEFFPKPSEGQMDYTKVFNARGTDKGDNWHKYGAAYQYLLSRYSGKFNLLEIGVYGGASLLSWADLFPEATIVGVDNNTTFQSQGDRIKVVVGDQSDKDCLAAVAKKYGPFQVIIDDGSHLPEHQQKSFEALWPFLAPGGTYVIEDLEVSYVPEYQSVGYIPTLDWLKSKATLGSLRPGSPSPWVLFMGEMAAIIKR